MTKIYLAAADERRPADSVLAGANFNGPEDENLACCACKAVVARGVSTRTLFERLKPQPGGRVLLQCSCGQLLLLPGYTN